MFFEKKSSTLRNTKLTKKGGFAGTPHLLAFSSLFTLGVLSTLATPTLATAAPSTGGNASTILSASPFSTPAATPRIAIAHFNLHSVCAAAQPHHVSCLSIRLVPKTLTLAALQIGRASCRE